MKRPRKHRLRGWSCAKPFEAIWARAAPGIDVFKASRFGRKIFCVEIRKLLFRELAKARFAGRHGGSPVRFKINVHEVPVHKTLFSFRRDEFCDFGVSHGGGFVAGIVLHREFPKEKTPLRSVARAKEPDACRRRADKARRRQVTDLEPEGRRTGAEESRGLFFGGKPQRKEVVEESGGGLVKRL